MPPVRPGLVTLLQQGLLLRSGLETFGLHLCPDGALVRDGIGGTKETRSCCLSDGGRAELPRGVRAGTLPQQSLC
ncbi:hypothetical protein NDU88_004602 [Pleurodeles waltl]|uniref:Uncharacterized protein n=1 Tax=Pleurodeles waltl TaxID=8319 RepID=A0AAV7MXP2_PLEWA|nr:hypothetical protein NDU88_004602 [Pleurodeles waltl]